MPSLSYTSKTTCLLSSRKSTIRRFVYEFCLSQNAARINTKVKLKKMVHGVLQILHFGEVLAHDCIKVL